MSRNGLNNKGGRPKGSKSNHTLEAEAAKARIISSVSNRIDELVLILFKEAKKGNVTAVKELMDRTFGKSPQAITGADGSSLFIAFDEAFKKYSRDETPPTPKENS